MCSEKDCCVMKIKFVLFWKRLLCSEKEIELCFASVHSVKQMKINKLDCVLICV